MRTRITARWIAPMDGRLVRDGEIIVEDGRVAHVGFAVRTKGEDRFAQRTLQEEIDLGDAVVLPGLVNAHAHLELSHLRQIQPPPKSLGAWLIDLILQRGPHGPEVEADAGAAAKAGAVQCLRFGVTSVGDISRYCQATRPVLRDGPLRVVSFGEVQAMGQRRGLLEERLAGAADDSCASPWLKIGLSPHAVYTVEPDAYRRCIQVARQRGLPLATHLAESAEEAIFLAEHSGPLREIWEMLRAWDEAVPRCPDGPIRFARALGLLDGPSLLAHVNICDDAELDLLRRGRASVVYCPRTHAYFGHPPHRWREMLAAGINVAVGTDSTASSPDLNLVDDLRLLHKIGPEVPPMTLWEMATARAARAIGMEAQVGRIAPGMAADLCAFPVKSDDPLREVLATNVLPSRVFIAGTDVPEARGS